MKILKFISKTWKIIVLLLILPSPAFAYLDPGSISLVFQAIIASLAGLLATYKLWIFKIKSLISRKTESQDLDQNNSAVEKNNRIESKTDEA